MKKYVARNRKTGESAFCMWEFTNTGMLVVNYFLPKSGFSLIWDRKSEATRIRNLQMSYDGRKSIASYFIHPNYWVGYNLSHACCGFITDAINDCFTDNIKLL